ncbi:DEAD/DEAH box helicase [Microlunatus parietis]
MGEAEPTALPDTWFSEPGPDRILTVHETGFTSELNDPSEAGALAAVHGALAADPARNEQIVEDVAAALSRGRNCLVLTRRLAHLTALAELLAGRGHDPLILRGGMRTADRRSVMERLAELNPGDGALVVGTTPFIGEGFDVPALDTLFLAAPISFDGLLLQCAGRVVRSAPGKTLAEVHDYHDHLAPMLAVSLRRRMPGYRALGFAQR